MTYFRSFLVALACIWIGQIAALRLPSAGSSLFQRSRLGLHPHSSPLGEGSASYSKQQRLSPLKSAESNFVKVKLLEFDEWLFNNPDQSFPHFVAGLVAGFLECLVGHPLDTIRVKIMTTTVPLQGLEANAFYQLLLAFSSPLALRDIYRGIASELLSCALAGCLLFGMNDVIKSWFHVHIDSKRQLAAKQPSEAKTDEKSIFLSRLARAITPGLIAAAGFTGFMDGITSKPLEMIKLRQQFYPASDRSNFIKASRRLIAEDGLAGAFRGWVPTVLRETLGNSAFFVAYELTKVSGIFLEKRRGKKTEDGEQQQSVLEDSDSENDDALKLPEWETPSTFTALMAGAMAGLFYVLTSHPLDIVAMRMQCDVPTLGKSVAGIMGAGVYKYRGMMDCISQTFAENGLKAFYIGAGPSIVRALPCYAASFWGYEKTLKIMASLKKRRERSRQEKETVFEDPTVLDVLS